MTLLRLKSSRLESNPSLAGILLVMAGGFIFSIQDVIIKYISGGYPVHEIVFFRSLCAILPILAVIRPHGRLRRLRIHNPWFHGIRGLLMFLCYTAYYLAIAVIPLSLTVTLFFCCPLFITVLSVVFLKEQMDRRKWIAVLIGFLGIVVVMRPDMTTGGPADGTLIHYGSGLALLSGFFYAVNAVCVRKYGRHESGISLVFYPMVTFLLFSGVVGLIMGDGRFAGDPGQNTAFLFRAWSLPTLRDFLLILIIGLVAAGGTYCLSQAYRIGEATVVAPFEYLAIPICVFWGYLFWNETPGGLQVIGILMIIAGGVTVLRK